ncbi:hypothetical protein BO94DRAFT_535292 [Aspergillus sclerotioniger CBS 115572]|uniref:Mediator of RNA polymerase II transcription subunit 20 n=1 Tax=Aspergillus sclerotioniger CBS 115572 TaxID=1450535 RepID=A0A317WSL5_9EURO|nr:hypothetical protein BO94DRAFT_535292 [Aspergillus sclerotioniger CBS 115572]PWY87190.1 hypothetical protein BO94DRAFT_535292 [Aspergillus sclerotioniger CBS 115572]
MPITGVYFIPSNPNASTGLATVTERLHTALADEPTVLGRWFLEHRLMRDTPSCVPASASQRQAQPRYMQFLSLSFHTNHGFIYTSEAPEKGAGHHPTTSTAGSPVNPPPMGATGPAPVPPNPSAAAQPSQSGGQMVMTTVPLPSCNALFQHFGYSCQPFWCHRHTVTVNGAVYDVGDFRVRVGDVKQTQPAARVRGTVVQIEWRGPSIVDSIAAQSLASKLGGGQMADDDSGIDMAFPDAIEDADIDAEYAASAALIREFWARLGIDGARDAILLPDVGKEVKSQLRRLKQKGSQTVFDDKTLQQVDEDPDPDAGVDVARQFMEILRFNR